MFQSLVSADNISILFVFIEGLLSFLSPCVIPIIPIYMSYLAGNAKNVGEDGVITYKRKKVFFHTMFFVLGISFAFFVLGMSITTLGSFFKKNQMLFTRVGGILIILFGLYQIGFLDFKFLQRERKIQFKFKKDTMNPLAAFLMGFTFSFAWTPCVGPALTSVLILASSAKNQLLGNMLVLVYALGFVIPFLLLGLFTTQVLNFLKKNQKIIKYTVKIGGVLLIIIGIMTFTGWMNGISKYLNSFTPQTDTRKEDTKEPGTSKDKEQLSTPDVEDSEGPDTGVPDAEGPDTGDTGTNNSDTSTSNQSNRTKAFDFTLTDQYGNEHSLSEYEGKVIFLNFWATWCPPCQKEMPDIEELYTDYGLNENDVIFLGVANPASSEYPNNTDVKKEEIIHFLEENEYTFPTVFDETGEILNQYMISAFPTTFLIDKEGYIYGYAPGMLTKDMMESSISQTIEATE